MATSSVNVAFVRTFPIQAFQNLPRLLLIGLLVLVGSALPVSSGEAPKIQIDGATMDELLRLYREYGLPLPPDDAILVKFPNGWFAQETSGRHTPYYAVGFWLNPKAKDHSPEILVGPMRYTVDPRSREEPPQPLDSRSVSLERVQVEWKSTKFPLNVGLATAIQCHARGLAEFALRLAQASLEVRGFGGGPNFVSSGGPWIDPKINQVNFNGGPAMSPRLELAGLAWNHWLNDIGRANSDWREIGAKMKHLLDAEPALADGAKRAVVTSIEASLEPRIAKAGSVEALIDELIDIAERDPHSEPLSGEISHTRLQELGFEAVPALIDHLDDQRMTRSSSSRFNNFNALPKRVGDLAGEILQEIAGEDLGKDWLARQVGQRISKADAGAWWVRAKKAGEEKYVIARVISGKGENRTVNKTLLRIIERRYPLRLPELYGKALGDTIQSAELAGAIGRSNMSRDEKLGLLERGLASASRDHQHWALREVQKIDVARGDRELVARLQKLPKKPSGALWTSPEARISNLVIQSDSPAVWEALLIAAKRAHVGLRMELMNPMSYEYVGDQQRRQRLSFLAAFLDDKEVRARDSDKRLYDGPCAGFQFDHLSVQDFAAVKINSMLKLPDGPQPDWTKKEWTSLRAKVRSALLAKQ